MSLSVFEKDFINQVSWEKALNHIKWLVNEAPDRHAPMEDEKKAAKYIQETLSEYGVSANIHECDAYLGEPESAKLTIHAPKEEKIKCLPMASSGSPISGEIICLNSREEVKERGEAIEDKIVMVPYGYPMPVIKPEEVKEKHGKAIITANWGGADNDTLRISTPHTDVHYWGLPTPEALKELNDLLPQIFITRKDFEYLKKLCKEHTVKATLESHLVSKWGTAHPVVAEIRSGGSSEDFVLIGGHFDSWSPGATDNATGVAMMIELARVLQKNREKLTRNVRVVFFTGHENGGYASSTWFVDNYWDEIDKHAVAFSVFDNIGFKGAPNYHVETCEELKTFAIDCIHDVLGSDVKIDIMRLGNYGDMSFFGVGLPSLDIENAFSQEHFLKSKLMNGMEHG